MIRNCGCGRPSLQFHSGFAFGCYPAVPYCRLGISPSIARLCVPTAAAPVRPVDHSLNPEIGTREDFDRLAAELARMAWAR